MHNDYIDNDKGHISSLKWPLSFVFFISKDSSAWEYAVLMAAMMTEYIITLWPSWFEYSLSLRHNKQDSPL